MFTLLDLCVSSLRRGHANLLCIVPILTDDPRRESNTTRETKKQTEDYKVGRGPHSNVSKSQRSNTLSKPPAKVGCGERSAARAQKTKHRVLAGRDEPRRTHTTGPTARHPHTGGSIPQHNILQHQGSTEPMLGKMGLPSILGAQRM